MSDNSEIPIKTESKIGQSQTRNRLAVAKSRENKKKRLKELQSKVDYLTRENSIISQLLAISQNENYSIDSRTRELQSRILQLENIAHL